MKTNILSPQPAGSSAIRDRGSAFTLVEMLVVIAVIAVLAAIALPSFRSAANKAKDTNCLSNLRQLYLGSRSYAQDNNDYTPMSPPHVKVNKTQWHHRVIPYLVPGTGSGTFQQGPGTPNYNPNNFKCFVCPMDTEPFKGVLSYGMSQLAGNKRFSVLPSRMILIGDAPGDQHSLKPDAPATDRGSARHGEKFDNFVFVDGHAEALVYPKYSDPTNRHLWTP